jgi:hypothetical protein
MTQALEALTAEEGEGVGKDGLEQVPYPVTVICRKWGIVQAPIFQVVIRRVHIPLSDSGFNRNRLIKFMTNE